MNGRKLASFTKNGATTTFTYDGEGTRIQKVSGDLTIDYIVIGGTIYGEIRTENGTTTSLHYLFDENGARIGFVVDGDKTYYYRFNLQGDVTGIYDTDGTLVAQYVYDAWGKLIYSDNTDIANLNPIRYRGYYYDSETGFYYVSSRYYDPEIGRFINIDTVMGINRDMATYNLFAYCGNNPVVRYDVGGAFWNTIIGTISGAVVGGITAAITGNDITAGIVGGAISGGISGAAIDAVIALSCTGVGALVAVAAVSGIGGALGSYANQRMNGTSRENINWEAIALDGVFAAAGSLISFGLADVGGPTCQTFKQIFSQKLNDIGKQFAFDFSTTSIIGMNAWLYSSTLQVANREKDTVVNYALRYPYGERNYLLPRGAFQR